MTTFVLKTEVSAPPERCFDLAIDMDEHVASTAHTGERIVAGVASGKLGPGDTVTFEARHFGLTMRMTAKVTEFDRPHRFVDEMQSGPFKSLWHEHRFEGTEAGTLVTDTMVFSAPFGVLGLLAERVFLAGHLRRLLESRNAYLKDLAEARR